MHYLVSLLLVAFLPLATGQKCESQGGRCDQICSGDTVPGTINDCAGSQYCCVRKKTAAPKVQSAPSEGKNLSGTETPAPPPAEEPARKDHSSENILVCSPLQNKYVGSNTETLVCNAEETTLEQLYKDGFRLIQIVEDGKKAIYYLDKK